jgi:hypothetical protein
MASSANRKIASTIRGQFRGRHEVACRSDTAHHENGATNSTPIASPAHHTDHVSRRSRRSISLVTQSDAVPHVALRSMAPSAAPKISQRTSRTRSSADRKSTRWRRVAAASGARVLPTAMTTAASAAPSLRLVASAPSATAGQTRRPNAKYATTATPVGGHNGVTTSPMSAS